MVDAIGSAEFRLAVECCRRSFREPSLARDDLPLRPVDWDKFLRLVCFHRIEGLAWNALANGSWLPAPASNELRKWASIRAMESLRAKSECRQLLTRFEAAQVPLLFLKGLTLGALAYGNPALKSAIDIDLLIDPNNVSEAAELLHESGYRLVLPRGSAVLESWHRQRKESVWAKDGQQVDLHTRTADSPRLIPAITARSPRQVIEIGDDVALPTLATDELFAYLAVHGASSAWFRLKWISDFGGLVHARPPAEVERLYRRSQELGAGRAAGQALLLTDALFCSLENCPSLRRALAGDRMTRLLFRSVLKQVTSDPVEPTERRLGTLTIHWTQFLLLRGLAYKWSEFARQAGKALRGA